jgi:4-carboxymuconolactone decarboxylase
MKSLHTLTGVLLMIGTTVAAMQAPSGSPLPKDIHPDTGNRFPGIKREALNDAGKKIYDARVDAFGPGSIRLYSQPVADSMTQVNDYLRHKGGLEPRLVELAILVTAREMDCEYVWTAHEPAAQKAGLPQATIDAVKYRRPLTMLGEKEAVIIQLGRDSISKHKVGSDTFARAVKQFGNQGVVNVMSLIGDYAATTILLNAADQHVRPADKPLLPIP